MGNSEQPGRLNRGIEDFILQQFERNNMKQHLTVSELLQVKHPEQFQYPFCTQHIGVLFKCDRDLDGLYSMDDLRHFALWVQQTLQGVQTYEFRAQLQAETMDCFLQTLFSANGEKVLVQWLMRLIMRDNQCLTIQNQLYFNTEQLEVIFNIFNVKTLNDMDFQSFTYLCKQAAAELGLKIQERIENDEQQQYIAGSVIEHLILGFVRGVSKITHEISYDRDFHHQH